MSTPRPTDVQLHQKSRVLELTYEDGSHFELPCEYLRVYSPSAEVRGHGPGQEVLQLGKEDVNIVDIKAVGNYALQFEFDDKHDTGIYSWELLYDLGVNKQKYWQQYLDRLKEAGYERREVEPQ
ncbi:MAG: DUF971 domain-containing protein [Gammaproteobacteria bacterium]